MENTIKIEIVAKPHNNVKFFWDKSISSAYDEQNPNHIYIGDAKLHIDKKIPLSIEEHYKIIQIMKSVNSEVFLIGNYFYTTSGKSLVEVSHPKLKK